MESWAGSVTPGKVADFVVLDSNLLTVDKMTIKDIQGSATYLGGAKVY